METAPKLLCVSLNPAIDRRIRVPHLRLHEVNRASSASPAAGGKAAHVAYAATALGARVRWLAFLGGSEGESCRAGIAGAGVTPVVVPIQASTRMTLELIDEHTNVVTEVLEPGPVVRESERTLFLREFEREVQGGPLVALSGSLPKGVPQSFYAELVTIAKAAGCHVLLDTSGESLAQALSARPHVIKPNRDEAAAILGSPIRSFEDALQASQQLRLRGPSVVIVSLGREGALVFDGAHVLRGFAPAVRAISTVGSGDSFLAGWAFAAAQQQPLADCLRLAIACGSANCLAASPAMISENDVLALLPRVNVEMTEL